MLIAVQAPRRHPALTIERACFERENLRLAGRPPYAAGFYDAPTATLQAASIGSEGRAIVAMEMWSSGASVTGDNRDLHGIQVQRQALGDEPAL